MADKEKKEKTPKPVKVDALALIAKKGGKVNDEGIVEMKNGAQIAVSKFRILWLNPGDGVRIDTIGESEVVTRKADGAIGIKFVTATPEADIEALVALAAKGPVFEPKKEDAKAE